MAARPLFHRAIMASAIACISRRIIGTPMASGALILDLDVAPVCELVSLLERIVEQRGQHLRGQLERYQIDPIEGLVARQSIEDADSALADDAGHIL